MLRRIGLLVLAALLFIPGVASAEEELRPDLGMAPLSDVKVTTSPAGQQQLRFSATIVNVGRGPFEVEASRVSVDAPFRVVQRVSRADGSRADVGVPAGLVYGGDGHDHWHIRDLETYQLVRLDGGVVSVAAKAGFCFYDTNSYRRSLPGAARSKVYSESGCGDRGSLTVTMGLSVGWADRYVSTLPDQFVDITGLPDGHYRLIATADAQGHFTEADRTNNATWVDLSLTSRKGRPSVRVLAHGPAA